MATTPEYNEFVCERFEPFGAVRSRKMFGEYMVYLNDKPIISVCDNTVFVKILPELAAYLNDAERGFRWREAALHSRYRGFRAAFRCDTDPRSRHAAAQTAQEKMK